MPEYHDTLIEAIKFELKWAKQWYAEGRLKSISHILVSRRFYNDESVSWKVIISDSFNEQYHMMEFDDDPEFLLKTPEEIEETIMDVWDEEWDYVQYVNPVGDFTWGSSDFYVRGPTAD